MSGNPGEQLSEEPRSERGEPASRDSGSDEPFGGAVDRPEGSIDDEAVTSHSDTDESAVGELRRHRDPSADDT
jgi:hypothetical protein